MKKLFSIILIVLLYSQSFAYNLLEDIPPPPPPVDGGGDGTFTPAGGVPGVPDPTTPINFIIPFLCISAICLAVYFIRKNKVKTV